MTTLPVSGGGPGHGDTLAAWPSYAEDEIAAAERVLRSGKVNYWTGDEGRQFEREFAAYHQASYGVALSNGTVALELALEVCGIGPGDEVIVTPRTFIASASCVVRLGAKPIFADVSTDSQNLTQATIEAAMTDRTRAVIVVHHAGWPCSMDEILAFAEKRNVLVIEDCAQAHGAVYKGQLVGSFGHAAAFSFCQDKIMTTGGEGGMLLTNDEDLWKKAWAVKDHGKNYDAVFNRSHPSGFRWLHESFGTNMRLTDMQAAIGRIQLKKLGDWNEQRNINANRIIETLSHFPCVRVPLPPADVTHAYYRLYAFVLDDFLRPQWSRDRIMKSLTDMGIPCFSGSCPEIYDEDAFKLADLVPPERMANAQKIGPQSLAFLVHPSIASTDMDRVCDALNTVLTEALR